MAKENKKDRREARFMVHLEGIEVIPDPELYDVEEIESIEKLDESKDEEEKE